MDFYKEIYSANNTECTASPTFAFISPLNVEYILEKT